MGTLQDISQPQRAEGEKISCVHGSKDNGSTAVSWFLAGVRVLARAAAFGRGLGAGSEHRAGISFEQCLGWTRGDVFLDRNQDIDIQLGGVVSGSSSGSSRMVEGEVRGVVAVHDATMRLLVMRQRRTCDRGGAPQWRGRRMSESGETWCREERPMGLRINGVRS